MKLFNDIRNFIDEKNFKIIIYDNMIDIINYKDIMDITSTSIIILSNKEINISGNDLRITKMLDNEIVIKGNITNIHV